MKAVRRQELYSFRSILLRIYLTAVLICFSVGIYNFISTQFLLQDMTAYIEDNQYLSEIQGHLNIFQQSIDEYIFSKSTQSADTYAYYLNLLKEDSGALLTMAAYDEYGIKLKNLSGYILYYLESGEAIMEAKRNNDSEAYSGLNQSVSDAYWYIDEYIQNTMAYGLQTSAYQYKAMQSDIHSRTIMSYALFGISIMFSVILLVLISEQVTRPITRLAHYSRQLAEGCYGIEIPPENSNKELSQLYDAFAIMAKKTSLYLEGLEEKRQLEYELSREQIKALETDNLLKQSELKALHAQMNPHFIFNTFNIGAQMAMLAGNEDIHSYMQNAADIFRYNLKGLNDTSLTEELKHVKAYMELLKIRFGNKLHYQITIDENLDTENYILPRMSLQPLVENAFIHGISPCEDGGTITVNAVGKDKMAIISIINTGEAFPAEKIDSLYNETGDVKAGHVSGIGIRNVIKRLQLKFALERPLNVTSSKGLTTITFIVPLHLEEKEGSNNEPTSNGSR